MLATTAEVDEIRKDAGAREVRLYLDVERGEWLLPRAVYLLQEKLNVYASFILDGKMRELYPYSKPQDARICAYESFLRADRLKSQAVPTTMCTDGRKRTAAVEEKEFWQEVIDR